MYIHFLGQRLWKLMGTLFQELMQIKYLDIFSVVFNPAEELSWSVWTIIFKRRFFFFFFLIMRLKKICEIVSHFFVLQTWREYCIPTSHKPQEQTTYQAQNKTTKEKSPKVWPEAVRFKLNRANAKSLGDRSSAGINSSDELGVVNKIVYTSWGSAPQCWYWLREVYSKVDLLRFSN